MLIEVIGLNVDDVISAEKSGADRIELCQSIVEDGLTPSYGLIKSAVETVHIPIHVMVRPHNRSFMYNTNDLYTMREDIKMIRELGATGIVIGPLTEDKQVDEQALQYLLKEAQNLKVTFHRAFDFARNQKEALETILQYEQITTILTSGGGSSALDHSDKLKELIDKTKGSHLTIMPGSGLRVENLKEFYSGVRPKALHFGTGVRENCQYEKPISGSKIKRIRKVTKLNK